MRGLAVRPIYAVALAGLLPLCAARAAAQERDVYRLFLPGYQRALDIDLRGFEVSYVDLIDDALADAGRPDKAKGAVGAAAVAAVAPARLLLVTFRPERGKRKFPASFVVRVEAARAGAEAVAIRDAAIGGLSASDRVSKGSIKRDEYKQAALLRYAIKGQRVGEWTFPVYTGLSTFPAPSGAAAFPGSAGAFPVLEAYRVMDGAFVWIRCDAFEIKEEEERLLAALLDSVKVVDTSRPSSSFDYYQLGRALSQRRQHGEAVEALARALALEQQRRQLSRPNWRQLIMTLANSLAARGDAESARAVFEYGAGDDPAYSYFHHGRARLHSYFGDVDAAIASLQKAYEHLPKSDGLSGGWLPDPLADAAFAKFRDERKFRDAVKAMKKQYGR